jgi:hypothetical protein
VRYSITSTYMSHTIICKYLQRRVATSAAISDLVRVGVVVTVAAAVGSVSARQDTSGTLASLLLTASMCPRASSSDNSAESIG